MALFKTAGIVLNSIKYGETSIIVKIYTKTFGLQSYLVNSVRTKKPKFSLSYFQPLSLLDMVVYYKKNASLNRIAEIRAAGISTIPLNVYKSGIALFMAETLLRSLRNELEDEEMFDFIFFSAKALDEKRDNFENFHLNFMLELSRRLGFAPRSGKELLSQVHNHEGLDTSAEANLFDQLIEGGYHKPVKMSSDVRRIMLQDLVKYFKVHIENFGEIKSLEVLRETLK